MFKLSTFVLGIFNILRSVLIDTSLFVAECIQCSETLPTIYEVNTIGQ